MFKSRLVAHSDITVFKYQERRKDNKLRNCLSYKFLDIIDIFHVLVTCTRFREGLSANPIKGNGYTDMPMNIAGNRRGRLKIRDRIDSTDYGFH